jgi:hypothetical protein
MNYRMQLSPISGVRESEVKRPVRHPVREDQSARWRAANFYRSWAVYDSDAESNGKGINWNLILGLGLALAVSVSFWVAAGLLIAKFWP